MKCPDCGGSLVEISLTGIDKTLRCFRCGGIWIKDNTLNELSVKALEDWKPVSFDNSVMNIGSNLCPQDNQNLNYYNNANIPKDWRVRKCDQCLGWWWPQDSLFQIRNLEKNDNESYFKVREVITRESI